MRNPGNSGHTGYQLSRVTLVEIRYGKVHVMLECGHDYEIDPEHMGIDAMLAYMQRRVGKKVRCEEQH